MFWRYEDPHSPLLVNVRNQYLIQYKTLLTTNLHPRPQLPSYPINPNTLMHMHEHKIKWLKLHQYGTVPCPLRPDFLSTPINCIEILAFLYTSLP